MLTVVQVMARPNYKSKNVKLKGLDPKAMYKNEETGVVLSGAALMNCGMNFQFWGDFKGKIVHLVRV